MRWLLRAAALNLGDCTHAPGRGLGTYSGTPDWSTVPWSLDRSLIVDMLRAQRQSRLWNKVSTDMYMEPSGGQALLPYQKHEVLVFVCDLRSPMSPQSPVTYDNQINTEPASQYRSQCPECTMPKIITRYPSASQIIAHDSKEE
jgi:hypothetical protein